jgi:hypothetical protein
MSNGRLHGGLLSFHEIKPVSLTHRSPRRKTRRKRMRQGAKSAKREKTSIIIPAVSSSLFFFLGALGSLASWRSYLLHGKSSRGGHEIRGHQRENTKRIRLALNLSAAQRFFCSLPFFASSFASFAPSRLHSGLRGSPAMCVPRASTSESANGTGPSGNTPPPHAAPGSSRSAAGPAR